MLIGFSYLHREIAKHRKTQLLKWIQNPFAAHGHEHAKEHSESTGYTPTPKSHHGESEGPGETMELMTTSEKLAEVEEIEEATPIELFYDLFFVANLTTVTSVHYITEWRSNYSLLICIAL